MFDFLRELTYADKILENSVLGKISCGAFNDTLTDCKQHNRKFRGLDPCTQLKHITNKCYTAASSKDFDQYINREFEETLMLVKFLQKKKSTLPAKMFANSWAIFTNERNLEVYEKQRLSK